MQMFDNEDDILKHGFNNYDLKLEIKLYKKLNYCLYQNL